MKFLLLNEIIIEQRIFDKVLTINKDFYLTGISSFLGIGLPEFYNLHVVTGVDVGGPERSEEQELELPIVRSVVHDVVDGNLNELG